LIECIYANPAARPSICTDSELEVVESLKRVLRVSFDRRLGIELRSLLQCH
jgi:hypothetical protein